MSGSRGVGGVVRGMGVGVCVFVECQERGRCRGMGVCCVLCVCVVIHRRGEVWGEGVYVFKSPGVWGLGESGVTACARVREHWQGPCV